MMTAMMIVMKMIPMTVSVWAEHCCSWWQACSSTVWQTWKGGLEKQKKNLDKEGLENQDTEDQDQGEVKEGQDQDQGHDEER